MILQQGQKVKNGKHVTCLDSNSIVNENKKFRDDTKYKIYVWLDHRHHLQCFQLGEEK